MMNDELSHINADPICIYNVMLQQRPFIHKHVNMCALKNCWISWMLVTFGICVEACAIVMLGVNVDAS